MLPGQIDKNADKKIQIITNSEIRYQGVLYQVNPTDKTIALREVISYGTELRRTDRVIPPVHTVYDCIVFRSTDIKDLQIVDLIEPEGGDQAPALESKNTGLPEDSADQKDSQETAKDGNSKAEPQDKTAGEELDDADRNPQSNQNKSEPKDKWEGNQANNQNSGDKRDSQARGEDSRDDSSRNYQNRRGSYNNHRGGERVDRGGRGGDRGDRGDRGGRGGRPYDPNGPKPAYRVLKDAQQDFDFDAMAEKMKELEIAKEETHAKQADEEDQPARYNPTDSFFDDISTSLENRGTEDDEHYKQYDINNETFGYVNRRGRGRGRGGRGGGYRGRGGYNRGGYNNYNRGGYNNNRGGGGYNNNRGGYNNNRGGYNNYNNRDSQFPSEGEPKREGEGGEGRGGYNNGGQRYGGRGQGQSGQSWYNNNNERRGGYQAKEQSQADDYTRKY